MLCPPPLGSLIALGLMELLCLYMQIAQESGSWCHVGLPIQWPASSMKAQLSCLKVEQNYKMAIFSKASRIQSKTRTLPEISLLLHLFPFPVLLPSSFSNSLGSSSLMNVLHVTRQLRVCNRHVTWTFWLVRTWQCPVLDTQVVVTSPNTLEQTGLEWDKALGRRKKMTNEHWDWPKVPFRFSELSMETPKQTCWPTQYNFWRVLLS